MSASSQLAAWLGRLDAVDAAATARRAGRASRLSGGALGLGGTLPGYGDGSAAFAPGARTGAPNFDGTPIVSPLAHEILSGRSITGQVDEERGRATETPRAAKGASLAGSAGMECDPRRGGGAVSKLAAGYQPAVVKVVSYAGDAKRAAATARYVQRDNAQLETQDGVKLETREAVQNEIAAWSEGFRERAESQDAALVRIQLAGIFDSAEDRATLQTAVAAAFDGHAYALRIGVQADGLLEARAVVVFAGAGQERFRVRDERVGTEGDGFTRSVFDSRSEAAMKARIEATTGVAPHRVSLEPGAPAHGVSGVTHRLDALVEGGAAIDHKGASIANAVDVRKAAQSWRSGLRSQGPRETMHLVMSAKAGVDVAAFTDTARAFLHAQFPDNKFMFAVHTDKASEGHIHAHAIVALRSDCGQKLHPGRQDFATWRRTYAAEAQAHGIKIVATHAAERASSQSYGPRDKAIVDAADRPRPHREARDRAYAEKNPHVVANARQRIETARANPIRLPKTEWERGISVQSVVAWTGIAKDKDADSAERLMQNRVGIAATSAAILDVVAKRIEAYEMGGTAMPDASSEQMYRDLRTIDKTIQSVAEQLTGPTRQAFLERSQPYLMRLAARVDVQRAIEGGVQSFTREEIAQRTGPASERIIAEADRIVASRERDAAQAERIAASVSNSEIRDEGAPSLTPTAQQDVVEERRAAELARRNAATERREADAAAAAARIAQQNPAAPISAVLSDGERLQLLRREQEALAKQIEEEPERRPPQGQRIR